MLEKAEKAAAAAKAEAEGMVIDVDADQDNSEDKQEGPSKRPRSGNEMGPKSKRRCVEKVEPTPAPPTTVTAQRARVCCFASFDYTRY